MCTIIVAISGCSPLIPEEPMRVPVLRKCSRRVEFFRMRRGVAAITPVPHQASCHSKARGTSGGQPSHPLVPTLLLALALSL